MSFDAAAAFLCAPIDVPIYNKVPFGMKVPKGTVALRVLSGVYGLRQSPRLWAKKLAGALRSLGFIRHGYADNYLFTFGTYIT